MQAVVKSQIEEDSAVLHDNVERADRERETDIIFELYPCHEVKVEVVTEPVVLQSEEHSVLHDEVQVKLERADHDKEAELMNKLYTHHKVKEMILRPMVLQKRGPSAEKLFRGAPLPKTPRLNLNKEKVGLIRPPTKENDNTFPGENVSDTGTPGASIDVQTTKPAKHKKLTAKFKTLINEIHNRIRKKTPTDNSLKTNLPSTCNDCQHQFHTKSLLDQHIKIHNKNKSELNFNCTECEYTTVTQDTLDRHLQLHDKQRQHVCESCGFRFVTKSKLQRHINDRHTVSKTLTCEVCDKFKTNRSRDLERHLRVHRGGKPFSCPQCEYKCKRQSTLKDHIRTHSSDRPFSCPQCAYRCTRQDFLKKHLRTHTGEKPFACPQCEYICTQRANLKRHISSKHRKV